MFKKIQTEGGSSNTVYNLTMSFLAAKVKRVHSSNAW